MSTTVTITRILPVERVACPKCGAEPGFRCRTLRTGRNTNPHEARRAEYRAIPRP